MKPLETQTVEEFENVLRINVVGVWLAMKHSVEPMKKRRGGSMIALSSVAGLIGFPGLSPYVASKHAVYGLVQTAALELGESAIRVNAIGPGPIDNRMMQSIAGQMGPEDPGGRPCTRRIVCSWRPAWGTAVAVMARAGSTC